MQQVNLITFCINQKKEKKNLITFQKQKKILNKNKQKAKSEMANIFGILESKIVGQISECLAPN